MSASLDIAIIGAAGRFPGAANIEAFWRNLCEGRESVTFFNDDELQRAGVSPSLLQRPEYVRAQAVLDRFDHFDAEFFGIPPAQAALLDPGHRVFLECAWEAFENAGYVPEDVRGAVGVYAGSSLNGYMFNVFPGKAQLESAADLAAFLSLDKDFLATRVSYHLNLMGPSIAVQTACSTSLVAVHLATQALLGGECDLALAGGVAVHLPQGAGYLYQPGGIASPDGHCRPFDARGQGTIIGSGAGVVLLKRLEDAIADGDNILCVIRGSAINNDGRHKVGFTAPSIEGQARVIRDAHAVSGVNSASVVYVEAHGTATPLGDPIEIAALTLAFGSEERAKPCVVGSVKSNVGHLDAAAGVTGLIKASLALARERLPATLHFETPHPEIPWAATPFVVSATTLPWPREEQPRRAGVSSFGLGGTNAHVVLEEAPQREVRHFAERPELFVLSARSEQSLRALSEQLAEHLELHPTLALTDIAYTLRTGRRAFAFRRACVASSTEELQTLLRKQAAVAPLGSTTPYPLVFVFPGQGAQVLGAGRELYATEPTFRAEIDACSTRLLPLLGLDLRTLLFPDTANEAAAQACLNRTSITQPLLFVLEVALARLWLSFGAMPSALLGHSVGEIVAACVAETLSLDDALSLVVARGRLMEATPAGLMLAVAAPEHELSSLLSQDIALAAVNAQDQCVLSGSIEDIEACERELATRGIAFQPLASERAFHSHLMDGVLAAFRAVMSTIPLRVPKVPWVSNVTGQFITNAEACDPEYWVRHLRSTVRFAEGLNTACGEGNCVVLEVGPGRTLARLARRHLRHLPERAPFTRVVTTLGDANAGGELRALLSAAGELWRAGAPIDLKCLTAERTAFRVPLPTTPFEGQRHWVDAPTTQPAKANSPVLSSSAPHYYAPTWTRTARVEPRDILGARDQHWLLSGDGSDAAKELAEALLRGGARVTQFHDVIVDTAALHAAPFTHAVQILAQEPHDAPEFSAPDTTALLLTLNLARLLGRQSSSATLFVVGGGANDVTGDERLRPELAPFLGICRTIPREYPNVVGRFIDVESHQQRSDLVSVLAHELSAQEYAAVAAHRSLHRWLPALRLLNAASSTASALLRERGVYLVTGGLGGLGGSIAQYLARKVRARLVLVQRREPDAAQRELLAALEREGSDVLCVQGDVGDAEAVNTVVAAALERFGAIHGVVHTAGVAQGSMIEHLNAESLEAEFRAKIHGAIHLHASLPGQALDFFLLCSSLTALSGGLGQAAYAAANCYLDAFAEYAHSLGLRSVLAVNFDRWVGVGMALHAEEHLTRLGLSHLARSGIDAASLPEVLHNLFSGNKHPRWVVSAKPLAELPDDEVSAAWNERQSAINPQPADIASVPAEDVEAVMCGLWSRAFGLARVAPSANFYELGGESLLALQIVNRVREVFGVTLSLQDFFAHPTPSALAKCIRKQNQHGNAKREPELIARPRHATRRPGTSGEGTGQ